MKNRKEKIIDFELAKLAFRKGYPVYDNINKTGYYNRKSRNYIYFGRTGNQVKRHLYGAPSTNLLRDWLHEVHGFLIVIDKESNEEYFGHISWVKGGLKHISFLGTKSEDGTFIALGNIDFKKVLKFGLERALHYLKDKEI